jgi:hypothetical protein
MCCAAVLVRESILLILVAKIVLQYIPPINRHWPACLGGLFRADFVAKVGEEQLASKNAQQSNRNEWIFESTLRIGA